jgi:hydroxyacylglutathione hydrolase
MLIETLQIGENFVYVLSVAERAAVVDPGLAGPVLSHLDEDDLTLDLILLTHYHGDHTGGVTALRRTGCEVVGPANGSVKLDRTIVHGDVIEFAGHSISAIAVPGHTAHDTAYYLAEAKALFTGDMLFACGCGRMFGNDAHQMWGSLCRLRDLPDDTCIYGGHNYTLENLAFAMHLEPDNAAVRERLEQYRANPEGAIPSTLGEEKRTNPFLRCDTESVAAAVNLSGRPAVEVFAAVRGMKDRW